MKNTIVKQHLRKGRLVHKHNRIIKNSRVDISERWPVVHMYDSKGKEIDRLWVPSKEDSHRHYGLEGLNNQSNRLIRNIAKKQERERNKEYYESAFDDRRINLTADAFKDTFKSRMVKKGIPKYNTEITETDDKSSVSYIDDDGKIVFAKVEHRGD